MHKKIDIRLSRNAERALEHRETPLIVELELYFSCLIRKRVLFPDQVASEAIPLEASGQNLKVYFRPVMTKACGIDASGAAPDLETFPIVKPDAFTPRWLALDFQKGLWKGEYGYTREG